MFEEPIKDFLWCNEDLLKDSVWPLEHPLSGQCYVASEALFHLTGGYDQWHVERCKVTVPEPDCDETSQFTHWYLRDRETGEITDLTSEQFEEYPHANVEIPYDDGTKTGFLTGEPSNRAQEVIEAVE